MNLAEKFITNLQKSEDKIMLIGLSSEGKISWQRTKKEILQETYQWIGALKAYGINKGDRVILSLGKLPSLFPIHIALLAVGATVVPLNPALTAIEIQQVLNKANARLAITKSDILTNNSSLVNFLSGSWWIDSFNSSYLENCFEFSTILNNSSPLTEISPIDKNDIALLVFTSGTTGKPKGVGITHNSLLSNLETLLISTWGFSDQDRLLHTLPPHHIHGLGLGIYGSLLVGNTCFLLEKFDPLTVLSSISTHKISIFMGVPTMYHRMLSAEGDFNLSTMRLFISGSAPLSKETFSQFNERFGFTILERYGLTETLFNASNPLNGIRKASSVGLPLSGVSVGIFDPQTFEPLKVNSVGEIWVQGPNVFSGYYNDPENTSLAFHNGWFRTGDLGRFDSDGYLSIVGRIKELIIVGGSNVTPGEIEAVLEKNPLVLECAVTSVVDIDLGEKIVACIVTDNKVDLKALEDSLIKACQEQLASYKRPKKYCFLDSLPRNIMGKLERNKLKDSLTN